MGFQLLLSLVHAVVTMMQATKYRPNAPWLLVGMQSDLRAQYVNTPQKKHVVEKDEAIQLAKDLGQPIVNTLFHKYM